MIKSITLNGRLIQYDLQRKQVKNINLRIRPDGRMTISANQRVSETVIEEFLQSQADRILRALNKCAEVARNAPNPVEYVSGEVFSVFGEDKTLRVLTGRKNTAVIDGDSILLTVKDADDKAARHAILQAYLDTLCRETLTALCHRYYPHFAAHGIPFPTLRFRHMTSRWGSCHHQKGIVTFNYALVDLPLAFAEYVVVHEFTHFLQPDHSKAFYLRLAAVLPDWKDRRKMGKR